MNEPTEECGFCGKTLSRDDAVEAGWEPYWWYTDDNGKDVTNNTPCCPECAGKYLVPDPQDRGDGP